MDRSTGKLILKYDTEEKWFINDIPVTNTIGLPNDIVYYENNTVIDIVERAKTLFVGVVNFRSQIRLGRRNTRSQSYVFKCLDSGYPEFQVGSRKPSTSNKYAFVEFVDWEKGQSRPTANVVEWLGDVGDFDTEIKAILYQYDISKIWKNSKLDFIEEYPSDPEPIFNHNYERIITIDPIGCEDIDDGLYVKRISDTKYTVSVHIANPLHYINQERYSYLVDMVLDRGFTVYSPSKRYDIFPSEWTTNVFSLKSNSYKNVMSVYWDVDTEANTTIFKEIKTNIVYIERNLTYEEANMIADYDNSITRLPVITQLKLLKNVTNNIDDFHEIVEYWMIMANRTVGEQLYIACTEKNINNTIPWRKHELSCETFNDTFNDPKITSFLSNSKAEYTTNVDHRHDSLNIDHYVHFTSPIRRITDIIIHFLVQRILILNNNYTDELDIFDDYFGRELFKNIPINANFNNILSHINNIEQNIKIVHREIQFVEWLEYINTNYDNVLSCEGKLIDYDDMSLTFYLIDHDKFVTYQYIYPEWASFRSIEQDNDVLTLTENNKPKYQFNINSIVSLDMCVLMSNHKRHEKLRIVIS